MCVETKTGALADEGMAVRPEDQMRLDPKDHAAEWFARLATLQPGYYYPWRPNLAPRHGEDTFRQLVFEHLKPELDVLEVACAQGDLALDMAPRCRSVLAYDFTAGYIDMARRAAEARGIANATFVVHDSSSDANGGRPRTPAPDHSIDLWVNSKGPWRVILDAPRVCRPGATLLMLVPQGEPAMPWEALIPEPLHPMAPTNDDPNWARKAIEQRLAEAGLRLHSWWDFDTPELFPTPKELYVARTFGCTLEEVPSYQEVAPVLERIFREFAGPEGLEARWIRHIWKAIAPKE